MDLTTALQIVGLVGGIATVLALFLAPMIYLGSKIDAMRAEMHAESKDFHARLCMIEEKRIKLLEK